MLELLELDAKLTKLTKEYRSFDERYEQIESEIEELESEKYTLKCEMERLEKEIKATKKHLLNKKIDKINVFTDDQFTNDFIRASYFALKDEGRPVFQYINITENELQATDTHRLIVITCPCIPNYLKNTKIMWDVRENFKDHIKRDIAFPNFGDVIPNKVGYTLFAGITPGNFCNLFKVEPELYGYKEYVNIDFAGVNIEFNKEYLDTALMCIGKQFDLYVKGPLDALMMESENTMILLLPVRNVRGK